MNKADREAEKKGTENMLVKIDYIQNRVSTYQN